MSEIQVCNGCGKEFKGARGLKSHQTHRAAKTECRWAGEQVAEESAPSTEPVVILGGVDYSGIAGSELTRVIIGEAEHMDAEEYAWALANDNPVAAMRVGLMESIEEALSEDAQAEVDAALAEAEPASEVKGFAMGRTIGEGLEEWPAGDPAPADRDVLIRELRVFNKVPTDVHTALIRVDGVHPWAVRVMASDAFRIMASAAFKTVVKETKHENGDVTTITDVQWEDGLRARVTERNAV